MKSVSRNRVPFLAAALLLGLAASNCDIYGDEFEGDFNAGGADPFNFPPAYRGAGQTRYQPGSGDITETAAFVGGERLGYYFFPFAPGQVATTNYRDPVATAWPGGVIDPLRVAGPGTDFRGTGNPAPVGLVYNFDPPGDSNPFAPAAKCKAPEDYTYDRRLSAYPGDQQWNIFTALPDRFATFPTGDLPTWTYRPIVAEVPVMTRDLSCQAVKSERTLANLADEGKVDMPRADPLPDGARWGKPTEGRLLAWALVDPGAGVLRVGETRNILEPGGTVSGTSVQKYGWYGQFIVQYIDGGYIPIEPGPTVTVSQVVDGKSTDVDAPTTRIVPQRIYYPRSPVRADAKAKKSDPGVLGAGYDVLQASRFVNGGQAYSPVCEVYSYRLADEALVANLPKSETEILERAVPGSLVRAGSLTAAEGPANTVVPDYIFCLQAAPLP